MTDTGAKGSTQDSRLIKAPPAAVFRAFMDPAALAVWQAPGDMRGEVHQFDGHEGGGYEMSLYYPESDEAGRGKTGAREDRYTAQFLEITAPHRIVESITFDSQDPAFAEPMILEVVLEAVESGTRVTLTFRDLPAAIRPEDNAAGARSSLDKLARYVE